MMIKRNWLLLIAFLSFATFLISNFPASTAYNWLNPPELRLIGIQGTIWSAQARQGSIGEFYFENLRFQLNPWQTLLLRLEGNIHANFPGGSINSNFILSNNQIVFMSLRGETTISALRNFLPIRGTEGLVSFDLSEVILLEGRLVNAVGNLHLSGLAVPPLVYNGSGNLISLGNYQISFDKKNNGLGGSFTDQGGPMDVSGNWSLNSDQEFFIEGSLKTHPNADSALIQGITFMTSEPDELGNRKFSFAGSL
ncbi:MAG: hypothetical protein CMM56_08385 [Rhodospirillaceae bacterium]|nr:hypothetical protein [Rhodospirillaceae bacterium]|tara:strand:- start:1196 stop:1954 length:759 start_codon:yes stop_codon:yes gene_type:complete